MNKQSGILFSFLASLAIGDPSVQRELTGLYLGVLSHTYNGQILENDEYLYAISGAFKNIEMYNLETKNWVASLPLKKGESFFSLVYNHRLYVLNEDEDHILVFDKPLRLAGKLKVKAPKFASVHGEYLYVLSRTNEYILETKMTIFDLNTHQKVEQYEVPEHSEFMHIHGDMIFFFNASHHVIEIFNRVLKKPVAIQVFQNYSPEKPVCIGDKLYFILGNRIGEMDTQTYQVNTFPVHQKPREMVTDGAYLYLSFQNSNEVAVISPQAPNHITYIQVGDHAGLLFYSHRYNKLLVGTGTGIWSVQF